MADVIPPKDFQNLKEQLSRMRTDRDRLRLVTQAAGSFKFTCDLVSELIAVAHYGEVPRGVIIVGKYAVTAFCFIILTL